MTVITRFAPSPTGMLHIGGVRTALFNYLHAKQNNGLFLLRIEDTDKQRSTQEAVKVILDGMQWLGLNYDKKPVMQSHNIDEHRAVALNMIKEGTAYYCYVDKEELLEKRINAEKQGQKFIFKSPYRNDQAGKEKKPGSNPVIRIKSANKNKTIINDLIQGNVTVENSEIDDFVLLRSDETPTYMLSCVADDILMKITHVIRGDDHLTNSFRQKILYQALGAKIPQFAHMPLIYGNDGHKLSKRHGAVSIMEYQKLGYLPKAIKNYLLRLAWGYENKEIFTEEEALQFFKIENVGKAPARFDINKLNHLNKFYLKETPNEDLLKLINIEKLSHQKAISAINILKERATYLSDLEIGLKIFANDYKIDLDAKSKKIFMQSIEVTNNILNEIKNIDDWNIAQLKQNIENLAQKENWQIKDYGPAVRVRLTFSTHSPGSIFEIMDILGKQETIKRLTNKL